MRLVPLLGVIVSCSVLLGADGCTPEKKTPIRTEKKDGNYIVDELFTHKGCTVYRFEDDSEYRYYVVCDRPSASQTSLWCNEEETYSYQDCTMQSSTGMCEQKQGKTTKEWDCAIPTIYIEGGSNGNKI